MSFSSRRRNYLLTPHRRDGLIEWYVRLFVPFSDKATATSLLMVSFACVDVMSIDGFLFSSIFHIRMKNMLQHSFVLDALETTGADTFSHFEVLIEEHRRLGDSPQPSRLQQLVPTIGMFHTHLPLRDAFFIYNEKHRLTKRKHIQISFNEIRHILNLAQIMAMRTSQLEDDIGNEEADGDKKKDPRSRTHRMMMSSADFNNDMISTEPTSDDDMDIMEKDNTAPPAQLNGPKLITFDGDQTLYSDGANFDENPRLANYLYLLLRHGVFVAIVTAAGYEYNVEKYEFRISGLLKYFAKRGLTATECERFYLFGGECNYLLRLGSDYHLHPVPEDGPGGWCNGTKHLQDGPANWSEDHVKALLDAAEDNANQCVTELNLRGRVIRKRRAVGLVPLPDQEVTRESLDETILRVQEKLHNMNDGKGPMLPFCAFNGGSDCWVDVGNKRVGVQVLQTYLGVEPARTLHIGDQFLNTGNDYAARACAPCIWIINPKETTYILKSILRLAGVPFALPANISLSPSLDFKEVERRSQAAAQMDVYTGELLNKQQNKP